MTGHHIHLSRRSLLAAGLALAAHGGAQASAMGFVDVHFHLFPPTFVNDAPGGALLRDVPRLASWTPEAAVAEMDSAGIARAIVSFPQPALWFGEVAAQRSIARATNEFYAAVVRDHPARFGLFAGLPPLTDLEGALTEIAFGLDHLGAKGVRVMSSYQDRWLGDPAFEPVWRELDRRAAVVFVHPDIATCCRNLSSVPFGHAELPLDTGRSVTSLWYNGVLARYPNIRFILSHGGGALPMIAGRLAWFGRPTAGGQLAHDALEALARLYVDTANASSAPALAGARALVGTDHMLFGSDAPFVDIPFQVAAMRHAGLRAPEMASIAHRNAERLALL
jgi:predicted TIM-barrel fold metal-dependent hydrolase